MFIKINRVEFIKRLRIVEKAISENKIRPIIGCVYLNASNNKLAFYGTNLEITMISSTECSVIEEGYVAFQPQLVSEYIKELSVDELSLKVTEESLIIETEDASTEFAIMNGSEYPKLNYEYDQGEETFVMSGTELLDCFEKVKFSAATGNENLAINCIRIVVNNSLLKFITTDTYRMTYLEKNIESEVELGVSLPLHSVDAITKLLKAEALEEIRVKHHKNYIYFINNEVEIICRIIELPYPNYQGILGGATYNKELTIKNEELTKILKRVQIFVKNNTEAKNGALMEFDDEGMLIKGVGSLGKVTEDSNISFVGDPIRISLNVKFILDFMQNLDSEKNIIIKMKESNTSVKIQEEGREDYTYIVMPLALKD